MEKAVPSKTTVELGISLAVKNGVLTTLIVDGKAQASLTVTLEWDVTSDDPEPADHAAAPVHRPDR